MLLNLELTGAFKRDLKRIKKQGKDMYKLDDVVQTIRNKIELDAKYYNHPLRGDYKDCLECHIQPDWLLIYKKEDAVLTLIRTGSHSELFE